jgi:hypothetical protein
MGVKIPRDRQPAASMVRVGFDKLTADIGYSSDELIKGVISG